MKEHLLHLYTDGDGRVPLSTFYSQDQDNGYKFTESVEYLRETGALDESGSAPRVLITNYLMGPSNCIASSSYYSVCCLNECEDIFSRLEAVIGKPEASPAEIVSALSGLASKAKRTFSRFLVGKLEEVAAAHGGFVLLHGRLFAQWMHLAYPRDCNYPHRSGTMYKKTMEEWEVETGERTGSTMQELKDWIARLSNQSSLPLARSTGLRAGKNANDTHNAEGNQDEDEVGEIIAAHMWTPEEEFIIPPDSLDYQARTEMAAVHSLAFVVALGATLLSVFRLSCVSVRLKKGGVAELGSTKRPAAKRACDIGDDVPMFRV